MPTLRVKEYAVRDETMKRLIPQNFLVKSLAEKEAEKLRKKGNTAFVVPIED